MTGGMSQNQQPQDMPSEVAGTEQENTAQGGETEGKI